MGFKNVWVFLLLVFFGCLDKKKNLVLSLYFFFFFFLLCELGSLRFGV